MQARPGEAGGLIGGAEMGAEVVRIPPLFLWAGEVPVAARVRKTGRLMLPAGRLLRFRG